MELFECKFTDKVNRDQHYIDGRVASKDKDMIQINSCDFEYENEHAFNIDTIKEDELIQAGDLQEKTSFISLMPFNFLIIIISVAMVIITLICIVLKLSKE